MSRAADLLFEGIGRGVSALAEAVDPDLPEWLRESEGRRLALVVRGTQRVLEIEVRGGALRVLPPRRAILEEGARAGGGPEAAEPVRAGVAAGASGTEPRPGTGGDEGHAGEETPAPGGPAGADLRLTGSVPDFVGFLRAIRREPPTDDPFGTLEVRGSAAARAGFVALLRRLEPDYESLLARATGGVVAHVVARTTVGRLYHAHRMATRLVDDFGEYLGEETRLVPDPATRIRFADRVQGLAAGVAELEERLNRTRRD